MPDKVSKWGVIGLSLVPVVAGSAVLGVLFWKFLPGGSTETGWHTLAKLGLSVVLALLVTVGFRFALSPVVAVLSGNPPKPQTASDANDNIRQRIAPLVLGVGSTAIVALAMAMVIAFTVIATLPVGADIAKKLDTLLLSVFSSVLPVFATWVGTVLAFYFTNESFRQAAQSAREATTVAPVVQKVTGFMIRYEKIARIDDVKRSEARAIPMDRVITMFNAQTTRVIVFDETKQPVFVLRRSSPPMPADWIGPDGKPTVASADKKIDDYLKFNNGENAKDASQFGFISQAATIAEARAAMLTAKTDLFVTASGQKSDPVEGWITEAMLTDTKKNS